MISPLGNPARARAPDRKRLRARTPMAGDEAGSVQATGPTPLALKHGQAPPRLRAGRMDAARLPSRFIVPAHHRERLCLVTVWVAVPA